MSIPVTNEDYNLLEEKWIPVLYGDGKTERVGICQALTDAGKIRQIAASNPMDLFAVIRFLLTLLYSKAINSGGVVAVRDSLLRGTMPQPIIKAINSDALFYCLFAKKQPFLQDITAMNQDITAKNQKYKSAGSLFAEMACGTNIAFFHHGDDKAMRLCLPCAAIGLLRLVPWSQSGGAGLSPAVHNAPPIVALACGANLVETLGLNLVPLSGKAGVPRWSGHFRPSSPNTEIPYLEALTWNPRRVHLGSPQSDGTCWRCGHSAVPVVGPIVYAKNEHTKLLKKGGRTVPFQWCDPAAFYPADSKYTTIKSYNEAKAAFGRDLLVLATEKPPASLVVQSNPHHCNWLLIVPCTNPAYNKSYDHRLIRTTTVEPDTLRTMIPADAPPARQATVEGWADPRGAPGKGVDTFLRAASRLFTEADWMTLRAAEYRRMDESPEAFDLFSGLHWSLRGKVSGLPSRNVSWLVLKLMATVPASARVVRNGGFCPLSALPKRQIDQRRRDGAVRSPYPRTLPRGNRLEAALRRALEDHMRKRVRADVDWAGLCYRLDELLD